MPTPRAPLLSLLSVDVFLNLDEVRLLLVVHLAVTIV
jgi:hypothetical protein